MELVSEKVKTELNKAFDVLRGESEEAFFLIPVSLVFTRFKNFDGFEFRISHNIEEEGEVKKNLSRALNQLETPMFEIGRAFEREFLQLNEFKLSDLLERISIANSYIGDHQEFLNAFDYCFEFATSFSGRNSGEFQQPKGLIQLLNSIYEIPDGAKIFNPFSGVGSLLLDLPQTANYVATEKRDKVWALGCLKLFVFDKLKNGEFLLQDSANWGYWFGLKRFDFILSFPAFMEKTLSENEGFGGRITRDKFVDSVLVGSSIERLNEKGKAIVVVPNSFLYRQSNRDLRSYLVENDLLDFVVEFPSGTLQNTGISISLIGLNKDKAHKGKILFYDAQQEVVKNRRNRIIDVSEVLSVLYGTKITSQANYIDIHELASQDYNLNPKRYINLIDPFAGLEKDVQLVALGDIITLTSPRFSKQEGKTGKLIRVRDLKEGSIDFEIESKNLESISEIPKQAYEISESGLLIALRWEKLKPSWLTHNSGDQVFVSSDIAFCKLTRSNIDIAYLISELHSDFVNNQAAAFRTGATVPAISKNDLLKIQVRIPTLDKQKAKVVAIRETIIKEKELELGVLRGRLGVEAFQQIATLKHSLGTPLGNLASGLRTIKNFINRQAEKGEVTALDSLLNVRFNVTLGNAIEDLMENLKFVSNLLDSNENELEVSNYVKEPLDLLKFIEEYISSNQFNDWAFQLNSSNSYEIDAVWRNGVFIKANKDLLRILLNNILDNAHKHAFRGESKDNNKVEIYTMIGPDLENNPTVIILISNNGAPFPENFDLSKFILKNVKAGDTGNTGIGGYDINKIVNYFDGKLELASNQKGQFSTTFTITLPLYSEFSNEEINDEDL